MDKPTSFHSMSQPPNPPPVGMPRRFGIATLMILTAVFALLFGVLKMLAMPPEGFACITFFVVAIAVSQAVLFKGKDSRGASIYSGVVVFYLIMLVVYLTGDTNTRYDVRDMVFSIRGALVTLVIGGILGYVVGTFIAAIFLVHKQPADAPPENAPAEIHSTIDEFLQTHETESDSDSPATVAPTDGPKAL
jgi:hypothetical protein